MGWNGTEGLGRGSEGIPYSMLLPQLGYAPNCCLCSPIQPQH